MFLCRGYKTNTFYSNFVQSYYKKCTYASKASLFLKNNRFHLLKQLLCYSLKACLHKSMQRGRFIRRSRIFQNRRAPLEYVLHSATVATRWASVARSVSSKLLQKMHIRKQTSTFFEKDRFYLSIEALVVHSLGVYSRFQLFQ